MTNTCNCQAEHWQPHKADCPAYKLPRIPPKHLKEGCYARADALEAHLNAAKAEIRSLDQANGGALREIERLTRDMVALQSQWDDMQQGFVEVFGEPVRDAIELLGATERLRSAHEPGAVSPDQALRGMAVYADEVPPIPAPEASIMKAFARSPRRVPTRDADHCDYPDCEQHWTMVLDRALAAMTKFHATFAPDEEDADLTPRTTSEAFREFVDEHARLLNIRATAPPPPRDAIAPSAAEAETPQSRSLFDMADTLIREMRKKNMWGMRSEYDNWTLRITRNEPGADNLHGGKARLACGCIDICTNQRDHDAHGQKSGEGRSVKPHRSGGQPVAPAFRDERLHRIDRLMDAQPGTPEGMELDKLADEQVSAEKSELSLVPCECLVRDKEPSAYHNVNCPRYVADLL